MNVKVTLTDVYVGKKHAIQKRIILHRLNVHNIYMYIYGKTDIFIILKTGFIVLISHKSIFGYLTDDLPQSHEVSLTHMSCRPWIMQELAFVARKSGVNSVNYYVLKFLVL